MICARKSFSVSSEAHENRLYLECFAELQSEEFRKSLLEALQFAKENHIKQWVLDFKKIGKLSEEEETWLHAELFPKMMMMLGSDNFVAIVLSEQCYKHLLSEAGFYGLQSYNSFIIMNTFYEVENAISWLDSSSLRCA
ncbi:hypothetical protein ACFSKU_16160 [Pontibacter silvestris]|uniref:STAS/SEC14 domain-containing protein n=1 Tax=Pontibacter silvestris TaxID=2305183 RepID=A0ABW4X2P6_9BACT|nr:hypothetical protein [Pontibacter silvestris]MCC9136005.1 hypothetical protein [Pontibacter silvestris]